MEAVFAAFAKFGDSKSDGKAITLTQSDKWMKQANVIDGKRITTTDTAICFNKLKQKSLRLADYNTFLQDLANYKKVPIDEIKNKMVTCGAPGLASGATKVLDVGAVDRLTDTSKYTGTHKERFDASGKGRGREGRVDEQDDHGYVTGYKGENTYDKTH